MRAIVFGLLGLAAIPLAALAAADVTVRVVPPEPPKGFATEHVSKATLPGREIRIWTFQSLDPDCSAHAEARTEMMEPPKHGEARFSDEPFFGGFPPNNVRYHCNTQKSPGRQLFYVSQADFHGHDKVVFQNSTADGRVRKWVVDIDVR